jgi:anaerobic magnesium-protoporphyrin IX monomethyl ester cyclase
MKATITFIPHDIFRRGQNLAMQPVTAIYLLGQILIDNGIDTRIVDPYELRNMSTYSYTEISDTVIGDLEILFFSSNSYNWANTKRVIEIIKANRPEISIVVGGIHPTMMDMRVMNTTPVDVIIRGEGERSIVEVARSMLMKELELSSIDGITYRDSNGHIIRNKDARPLTEEEYAILQC